MGWWWDDSSPNIRSGDNHQVDPLKYPGDDGIDMDWWDDSMMIWGGSQKIPITWGSTAFFHLPVRWICSRWIVWCPSRWTVTSTRRRPALLGVAGTRLGRGRSVFHGNSLGSGFFRIFSPILCWESVNSKGFLDGECIDADFGVDLFADTVMQKMVDLYSLEGSQEEIDILNQLCLTLVLNSASWRPFGEYLAVSSHESQWRPVSLLFLQVYSLRKTTHSWLCRLTLVPWNTYL